MGRKHFADRLLDVCRTKQSQVVVGLDPRVELLPVPLRPGAPTPDVVARAVLDFNRAVIDAVAEHAVAVKPQLAFYETLGRAGMGAYADTVAAARERGLIVIGDAKRNDIGSTAAAYAAAHLGDGEFGVDAVTVNAYLGSDGVQPFIEMAADRGRGLFVLVKTSNPSSVEVQDLDCAGAPLYERLAARVAEWGADYLGEEGYSLVGAVAGGTFPGDLVRLRGLMPAAPLLVPGFGAQGAGVEDVAGAFDADGSGAVVNSSRGIIFAWRHEPYANEYGEAGWQEAIRAAAADMRESLWQATHPS